MAYKFPSRYALWRRRLKKHLLIPARRGSRHDAFNLEDCRKITLVKRDNIGDFVLATTFCRVAYERWADREVTLVCSPAIASLARVLYPRWIIRTAIADDRSFRGTRWLQKGLQREVRAWPEADLLVALRSTREPDDVILDSWIPARRKVAMSNQSAPNRQFLPLDEGKVYDILVAGDSPPRVEVCRDILNYRCLLDHCFPSAAPHAECWPCVQAMDTTLPKAAEKMGVRPERFLALCPFPSSSIRLYPEDRLVTATRAVAKRFGFRIVIFGGPADIVAGARLGSLLGETGEVISTAGHLTLVESMALLGSASAVLSVETGLAHFAVARGVPTVGLLGGGHFGQFAPWGDPQSVRWLHHPLPCYQCNWLCQLDRPRCVQDIEVLEVERAFEALLNPDHPTSISQA